MYSFKTVSCFQKTFLFVEQFSLLKGQLTKIIKGIIVSIDFYAAMQYTYKVIKSQIYQKEVIDMQNRTILLRNTYLILSITVFDL